ncbi:hypothetical protein Tco_1461154, partial [Tanacetum coccineum]
SRHGQDKGIWLATSRYILPAIDDMLAQRDWQLAEAKAEIKSGSGTRGGSGGGGDDDEGEDDDQGH